MKRAFLCSCNEFADPGARLRGCVNDSKNIRDYLMRDWAWDPAAMRVLCDARATDVEIYKRLEWCAQGWQTKPNPEEDTLFIGFSMHGSQVTDRNGDELLDDSLDEILCPFNFPDIWDDPLSDDKLAIYLKAIPEGVKTVVIADACHSGTMTRGVNPHYRRSKFVEPPFDIQARSLDRKLSPNRFGSKSNTRDIGNVHIDDTQRHIYISGCKDAQTSADADIGGVPQGAMTWAFVNAAKQLRGATIRQIHAKMLQLLGASGFEQTPQLSGPTNLIDSVFSL